MTEDAERTDAADDECTTTRSFDDHGIDDGSDLIRRPSYRLVADGDGTFEPTDRSVDRLADAFRRAYLTERTRSRHTSRPPSTTHGRESASSSPTSRTRTSGRE